MAPASWRPLAAGNSSGARFLRRPPGARFQTPAGRPLLGARARTQVVFLGLDILVPLMTGEQLAFPKLARAYFALLAYMLEVYPERVAALPGAPRALPSTLIQPYVPYP